ncbi:MAG: hypothetical protein ACI9OT_001977, partial [Gammaproteobacteria bacterium]
TITYIHEAKNFYLPVYFYAITCDFSIRKLKKHY